MAQCLSEMLRLVTGNVCPELPGQHHVSWDGSLFFCVQPFSLMLEKDEVNMISSPKRGALNRVDALGHLGWTW